MIEGPRVEDRPARPYVALRRVVSGEDFAAAIDDAFPRLLAAVEVVGTPFIRYRDESEAGYDIDLAVPVATLPDAVDDGFVADELPAGRWAVLTHLGPYEELEDAHAAIDDAGYEQDDEAGARIEIYVTDPRDEPDPANWRVQVEQLLLG